MNKITDFKILNGMSVASLSSFPTIHKGHTSDLKCDTGRYRYWWNRCGPDDGAEWPIEVEELIDGAWVMIGGYGNWQNWKLCNKHHRAYA